MILAKFTEAEANTKSMQRKVAQSMPMKAKKASLAAACALLSMSTGGPADTVHLNTDVSSPSNEEGGGGCISSITLPDDTKDTKLLNWKPPRHCSNAKQMQEMREAMLREKAKFSRALKAATKLFTSKREKENSMLTRQVAAMIKKKYKGVGPSHATINHYVVNLGLIGVSPLKTGPKGNIPLPDYKALCAAFT